MQKPAYYNEFDSNAAAWLRELIKDGLIAPGDVDERSIIDVKASDLKGYSQHHFFAGIGGWSYALRLAGWPDNQPVWTASLPCQPFSTAGKQLGKQDDRHLLPHFLELVKQCRPHAIFGEQVERAIGHGWLDDLQTTMEAEGYSVGHCVLGAHSIGAAHIRQRLYWVADSTSERRCGRESLGEGRYSESGRSSDDIRMANTKTTGKSEQGHRQLLEERLSDGFVRSCEDGIEWIHCRDGKYRPVESSILPLVDGVSEKLVRSSDPGVPINSNATQEARVMRLRGYGNAIVPTLAAEFIGAFMDVTQPPPRTSR